MLCVSKTPSAPPSTSVSDRHSIRACWLCILTPDMKVPRPSLHSILHAAHTAFSASCPHCLACQHNHERPSPPPSPLSITAKLSPTRAKSPSPPCSLDPPFLPSFPVSILAALARCPVLAFSTPVLLAGAPEMIPQSIASTQSTFPTHGRPGGALKHSLIRFLLFLFQALTSVVKHSTFFLLTKYGLGPSRWM